MEQLIKKIEAGDEKAIGRAISIAENDSHRSFSLLKKLYKGTALSYLIGITGPPGSGKSTLTEAIVKECLKKDMKIGIIAIDPTSQFSGGALLGDRIRMNDISLKENVFIRSMATRGLLGGLNTAIYDTVLILSRAGFDYIIIETVGIGQNEIDIVNLADTVLVVTTPEAGDEIQTFKAGIMETGDIFIVNKADRPGANKMELLLKQMVGLLAIKENAWQPPVIKTSAKEGKGIRELVRNFEEHHNYLIKEGIIHKNREKVLKKQLLNLLERKLREIYIKPLKNKGKFDKIVKEIIKGKTDPYTVIERLVKKEEVEKRDEN